MVSVGTIVWLSSELMFFAALFAMYYTIRSVNVGDWPPVHGDPIGHAPVHLHVVYALTFTTIPVTSTGCGSGS
jgi:cytochrome c oxidase subunit 3